MHLGSWGLWGTGEPFPINCKSAAAPGPGVGSRKAGTSPAQRLRHSGLKTELPGVGADLGWASVGTGQQNGSYPKTEDPSHP